LLVFPNPAKDIFHISISGSMINKPATICLFSIDGRVLSRKMVNALGSIETIDVRYYPDGQYILKLATDNETFVRKIKVINH
jgi:uncharacterized protein YjiK